jgi:hypothetical protein
LLSLPQHSQASVDARVSLVDIAIGSGTPGSIDGSLARCELGHHVGKNIQAKFFGDAFATFRDDAKIVSQLVVDSIGDLAGRNRLDIVRERLNVSN